jgi:hypothetical protein
MGIQTGFHAPRGAEFLGYRKTLRGTTEVVYDDGVSRRMIWRLPDGAVDEAGLSAALERAVGQVRVVPALLDELKRRAIPVERVTG